MDGYLLLTKENIDGSKKDIFCLLLTGSGKPISKEISTEDPSVLFVRLSAKEEIWKGIQDKDGLRIGIQKRDITVKGYEPLIFTHANAIVAKTLQCLNSMSLE